MTLRNDESINLFVRHADCARVSLFHYLSRMLLKLCWWMHTIRLINESLHYYDGCCRRDSTSRSLKQSFVHLIDLSRTSYALTKNNKQINTWCLSISSLKVIPWQTVRAVRAPRAMRKKENDDDRMPIITFPTSADTCRRMHVFSLNASGNQKIYCWAEYVHTQER